MADDDNKVVSGPFGGMTSEEAAEKSRQVRAERAKLRQKLAHERRELISAMGENMPTAAEFRTAALRIVFEAMLDIITDKVTFRDAKQAAEVATVFTRLAREFDWNELDESLQNIDDPAERAKMMAHLKAELAKRTG